MEGTTFVTYSLEWNVSVWQMPALLLSTLSWSVVFLLSFLFPNGRFVPRWTPWLVVFWIGLNIIAIPFPDLFAFTLFSNVIWLFLCACCMAAQIYRYRRVSNSVQRQQTKWVVYGTSVGIAEALTDLVRKIVGETLQPLFHSGSMSLNCSKKLTKASR